MVADRTNGTTYYYRVRAVRTGWNPSPWLVGDNGCSLLWDAVAPGPATGLVARAHGNHAHLSWVNPPDLDFAGVRVLRRTDHLPTHAYDGTLIHDGSGQSIIDRGLAPGVYYYSVFAHDARPNFSTAAAATALIAPPPLCESCHNGDGDGDGVWTGVGYDPDGAGPLPAAPNVMGDGMDALGVGEWAKPYDDGRWGCNVSGHGANGTAPYTPHFNATASLEAESECTDCHDISIPAGTHLDGVLNSVELKLNPNENTAHLNATFIGGATPLWSVQLTFDNGCRFQCHTGNLRRLHHGDNDPTPGVVRFGDKGVNPYNGEVIPYPIDSALTTNASTDEPDFAPCISCHNPHGTHVVQPSKATNRMLRATWEVDGAIIDTLCSVICHRLYP